jgi:guanylate kinase
VFLEIEINGASQVLSKVHDDRVISFFLMPPSINALEKRIRKRKTETEEIIQERLEKGRKEMTMTENYDHIIINDKVERAAQEIVDIIKAKMKKR